MKKKKNFFVLIVLLSLQIFNVIMAIETPEYNLLEKEGKFELRVYNSFAVARTRVENDYREATVAGFRKIANYIFGGNDKNMEIAMTAPVISNSPGDVEGEYEILFVMPSSFKRSSLPKPNSSTVEIMDRSLNLIACISFGGWATKERAKKYHLKLSNWLKDKGYEVDGKFMVAQYNSPWALPPFRHNEIMVRIKK